jgi:CrcB protein
MAFTHILSIAAGGALGALLRYGITGLGHRLLGAGFPWGTLLANLLGCFFIGLLWALSERTPFTPGTRLFVFTGVLGAFTTFSTYGLESMNLFRDGQLLMGFLNIAASNLIGLASIALGMGLGRLFHASIGGAP